MEKEVFEKARNFMYRNARPLDLARFQYHFENSDKEAVMNVLSYYQNADGGCGHAIEADCWNPNSTPLHTGGACDIIREINYENTEHPVIKGILNYLGSGKDFNGKGWNLLVESNNNYPHAPWWQTESVSSSHTDYNGTAQIAGFIVRYADRDTDLFNLGLRIVREAIEAIAKTDLLDMHTCGCYIHMADYIDKANVIDLIDYETLKSKLHESVNKLIETDKTKWGTYICKPSSFMNSKKSEFYNANKEIAEYESKYIINTQLEDGSWDITWSWENYPDQWSISKNWWKGHLTIQNLLYLKGFGMI